MSSGPKLYETPGQLPKVKGPDLRVQERTADPNLISSWLRPRLILVRYTPLWMLVSLQEECTRLSRQSCYIVKAGSVTAPGMAQARSLPPRQS